MRRRPIGVLVGVAAMALATSTLNAPADASPARDTSANEPSLAGKDKNRDNLTDPLSTKRNALREKAVTRLLDGKAKVQNKNGSKVIKVGNKYVEYGVQREEAIFTVLAEFGDQVNPATGGTPGPLHNQIAKPDRNWDGNSTDDNSTYWEPNFDRSHYRDLMFGEGESFKNFYRAQSNGRFEATGDVSDWVKVPFNEARYGSNKYSSSSTYWPFVRDTAKAWYDAQVAAGKTNDQIKAELAGFDKWDRYDHDNDGDFNEPDGYIDHFQAIHAGEGEEAGGGAQGSDAIWSHRWYAYSNGVGSTGPDGNKLGGVPIGDSGMWIGDYTTEPENGGLGVFTHEFGHDLGLPDLYDTSGGDNGTGFWTLMSAGSWLNHGIDSIGTTPGYMGPWEKLYLGWLDHRSVAFGDKTTLKLGAADKATKNAAQALLVDLPDKTVTNDYNEPFSGEYEWWGGSADGLNTTLTRPVDLTGVTTASLSTKVWYDIEADYDYLYGQVSTDGGTTWTDAGTPLDGSSNGQWVDKSYDLTPYAGKSVLFRFRYATDGGVHYAGPFLDDIALTLDGVTTVDDVESGNGAWTPDGFTRMTGSESYTAPQYYLAENRVYSGYDKTLQTGPYNFGWGTTKPDWVERFPYQNGLLVWYADGEFGDNNTREHPGGGQVLPVDARPTPVTFPDGRKLGNRRQPFDATFGQEATDAVTFHRNGVPTTVPSQPAMPVFDDRDPGRYWSADNPWSSVKVAGSGTQITVLDTIEGGEQLVVQVTFKK